ncbi:MAG: hypothetical protein ABJF23_09295 [Bryobacteraceae bacterium]
MGILLRRSVITILVFAACLLTPLHTAVCAGKPRDWHTGKLLDSANASHPDSKRVVATFHIEGEMYAYLAQERMKRRWSKPAAVKTNTPVKFAVVDRKLFLLDQNGKEHEMEIVKKILRRPPQPRKPRDIMA